VTGAGCERLPGLDEAAATSSVALWASPGEAGGSEDHDSDEELPAP